MRVSNTTLDNVTKRKRLSIERRIPRHHAVDDEVVRYLVTLDAIDAPIPQILYSMGVRLLPANAGEAAYRFVASCEMEAVDVGQVPHKFDVLGSAYQYLSTKAESLSRGAFYTGPEMISDLVGDLTFTSQDRILDPACGSGALLMGSTAQPGQLVGVDNDPVAVMIATFNYFIKFPAAPPPHIFCCDFFEWESRLGANDKFSHIIANPPYGAFINRHLVSDSRIKSGESFSFFLEAGVRRMGDEGVLRYIVPSAALNVPKHSDLRDYLFEEANVTRIKRYSSKFAGVMSDVYMLEVKRGCVDSIEFEVAGEVTRVSKKFLDGVTGRILSPWKPDDFEVLDAVMSRSRLNLRGSVFGLGVVTGNNREKLLDEYIPDAEPIYTGKQVERFHLSAPQNYLVFDRGSLQQVAPDSVYRASEKLVYKVISYDLKFALDRSGSLTTNSANIVIPRVPGYSPVAVMCLLNSPVYSFIHRRLFGGVNKIARRNLEKLPMPELAQGDVAQLEDLYHGLSSNGDASEIYDFVHHDIFGLTSSQVTHILNELQLK